MRRSYRCLSLYGNEPGGELEPAKKNSAHKVIILCERCSCFKTKLLPLV